MCLDLLTQALGSPYGIAVSVPSTAQAYRFRRQCYAERERARRTGNRDFDGLSIIIRPGPEVWIVCRSMLRPQRAQATYAVRPLSPNEVPTMIPARGKRRPSALINVLHSLSFPGSARP
jgi:hypothetical protein